jgi:hypothetical protein
MIGKRKRYSMTHTQPLDQLLRECAEKVGGKNFFLTLTETIRTTREGILKPLTFTVTPKNSEDGEGFSFSALEVIDEKTTRVSPLFKALFVMPIDVLKKTIG